MADTWITPDRKKNLLSYIDQLKNMSKSAVDEEDLYAAGFSEKDLEDIGWFNKPTKASVMDSDGSKLEAYSPTSRDNVRNNVSGALQGLGLSKNLSGSVAMKVAGAENPTDGGLGMGLADFTPFGALFGVEEGVKAAKRGYNTGDITDTALGVANAGLSVASAIPGVKAASKGVEKVAEKLMGQYDPSVTRTFFGPTSASADLNKLASAKELAANGADETTVWRETGWWNGPNGWRFEVDDSKLALPHGSTEMNMYGRTGDAIQHDEYWKALEPSEDLPDAEFNDQTLAKANLRDSQTSFGRMDPGKEYKGSFNPSDNSIKAYGYKPEDQKDTLVHEMQHAIQTVLGDSGKGANPEWINQQFQKTLDELPPDLQRAAKTSTELGFSKTRYKEIDKAIAGLEAKVAKEAALNEDALSSSLEFSGEGPFDFLPNTVDTSVGDQEALEALYAEKSSLGRILATKSELVKAYAKAYPDFASAISEFETVGTGIGTQWFSVTPNLGEDLFSKTSVIKDGGLTDFASHTLYTLDAGEVEARIAGDRASWLPEERAYYPPAADVMDKNTVYTADDLINWFKAVKEDAIKSKSEKGYAKGGVVQEIDPVSGNEVPPGAEPVEVRDNVDAELSEGEYVIPADVVRYLGLDKIEKLVSQAKEGLAEMDKQGRIGGETVEEPDELPFTDEELGGEPLQMAVGGLIPSGDRIRSGLNTAPQVSAPAQIGLPSWLLDSPEDQGSPRPKESWRDNHQPIEKQLGMAGPVEGWKAKDFSSVVKQRSGDLGVNMIEGLVSKIPFGGLALRGRHKYLDKKVPGAIDAMLKSGKDVDGTALSEQQIADLQKAKVDFTETVGYKPGGFKGLAKGVVKSIISPKDKTTSPPKETSTPKEVSKRDPNKDKPSSSDKKDDKKK